MVKQLLGIAASLLLALSPAWAAKLYKWTDENGTVHYSDKLPPDTVDKAHQELNSRGVTTKSINREKTAAEKQEEAAAQAMAEAEKKRVAEAEAQQRARDQNLLNTFTTERDLLLTREDRITSIDSTINLTVSNNATMEKQAVDTRTRIEATKAAGKEVPENMVKQLESLEAQISKNKSHIENKRLERIKLEQQFDADLKRYRELKGSSAELAAQDAAIEAKTTQTPLEPPKPAAADPAKPKP